MYYYRTEKVIILNKRGRKMMNNHNIIKLDNALNFRDLGGYRSQLGGVVKSNKLYRSDSLANLSQADIDT